MIFVDTNILIDAARPQRWTGWSRAALLRGQASEGLVTNFIVVAELAPSFDEMTNELSLLKALGIDVLTFSEKAAWRAGRAHLAYRRAGGERSGVLPDFLIGGHAVDLGATLLTRDRQRFAAYFPDLPLITPETHP